VDKLVDHLLPQLRGPYDALLMITRGGIVPGGLIAEALDLRYILTAAVEFPEGGQPRLAWPTFLQFPGDALLKGKRVLVVDDIWENGRTITTVTGRIKAAGGLPQTAVLHYKPGTSLFKDAGPDFYAAVTDRFIVYPWEIERGPDLVQASAPQPN
jgi:hypoxanthine phosphoribosyltransferase